MPLPCGGWAKLVSVRRKSASPENKHEHLTICDTVFIDLSKIWIFVLGEQPFVQAGLGYIHWTTEG
jgi:hypothetical protein